MADVIDVEEYRKTSEDESGAERGPIRCKCVFFNQAGQSVHVNKLTHTIDGNETVLLQDKDVGEGKSLECRGIVSYSGVPVHDYWYLEIVRDGHKYSNNSFWCDLTSADGGGTVTVRVDKSYLYTDFPESSGCWKTLKKR